VFHQGNLAPRRSIGAALTLAVTGLLAGGPGASASALSGPVMLSTPATFSSPAKYLWIKDPGASDGPRNGGPPAGQFWPQYAITLARGRSPVG
jgi:hypothetical protein